MTVAQLVDEYVNLYGLSHWSESTLSANRHRIDDYIVPYIGTVPIKTLTTHRLEKFYRKLLKEPAVKRKGREQENNLVSFSVIEKVHGIIRSALNQAIRWDYLKGSNPAMTVELPKHRRNKREIWTEEEVAYALSVCEDPILKLCILLAIGCSMRIGEILGLTWDCIHIELELVQKDEAYLSVEKELRRCSKSSMAALRKHGRNDVFFPFPEWKKTNSTTALVLKTPKTESSVRMIYLPKTVILALIENQKLQEQQKADLADEYQDYHLVIAQPNGRPYEEHQIAQKMKRLISECNLKPVVFHSLRHSSTSIKLKISGNIKAVQGDTGHSQSRMVTDVYSHVVDSDRKHLARKFNDHFFSDDTKKDETKKAAASDLALDESTQALLQLLQSSPELAGTLLQLTQTLKQT